jgi:hypothetical protein
VTHVGRARLTRALTPSGMKTLPTARSIAPLIGQERVEPLESDSLGMECSEESDAFLPDRNAPRVIN